MQSTVMHETPNWFIAASCQPIQKHSSNSTTMVTAEHFIVTVLPGFQPQGEVRYLTCVGGFCLVCSDRIPLQLHSHPVHLKISGMSFEVYSLRCTIRVENSNRSAFQSHAVRDFKTGGGGASF